MTQCLVIEDSPMVASILAQLLAEQGHEVETVACPGAAVTALDPERGIGIAFLDWDLPGLGALDVLNGYNRYPRAERPALVVCATENDPRQFALAKAAGAAHHLLKPVDAQSLGAVIRRIGLDAERPKTAANG